MSVGVSSEGRGESRGQVQRNEIKHCEEVN